jgi:enoyl-CoA hydratase/carnithine racemase
VVLTGAGDRAFCTGADLRVPLPTPPKPEGAPDRAQGEVARGIATGWQRVITAVLDCEKPVVAAVNGTAAGAGMHLALACDVIVMADTAKLVPVFVRRGIAPDAAGAYLLTRLVGPQIAKRLYLFGDDVPAAEALRLGLVGDVVGPDELQAARVRPDAHPRDHQEAGQPRARPRPRRCAGRGGLGAGARHDHRGRPGRRACLRRTPRHAVSGMVRST